MERARVVAVALLVGTRCAATSIGLPSHREGVVVDLLEDSAASVVELRTGRAQVVSRSKLPAGVREGEVLIDGRTDPSLTRALLDEVRAERERLAVPVPSDLAL